jgi:phosphotriesterase-related protein
MARSYLQTVTGPISTDQFGLILPHEHLFTDLRGPEVPDYAQADREDVVQALSPILRAAQKAGVTGFVECSTIGVGRNAQMLRAISQTTPIHIIMPTGVYRDDYVPAWIKDRTAEDMAQLWVRDLTSGVEDTGLKAGFIKIAVSDDGPRPIEERILKSAAIANRQTGAVVASHTPNGAIFKKQWRILEEAGLPPDKFIWVHANLEKNEQYHLEAANIGVFVEFDGVGAPWQSQQAMVDATLSLVETGYLRKILLSHDAGWYQPGRPQGEPEGGYRGYTALTESFIPALRAAGLAEENIEQITHHNPFSAFALEAV